MTYEEHCVQFDAKWLPIVLLSGLGISMIISTDYIKSILLIYFGILLNLLAIIWYFYACHCIKKNMNEK
jgi:hypothetical protein